LNLKKEQPNFGEKSMETNFTKGKWYIEDVREKNEHGATGIDISSTQNICKFATIWAIGKIDKEAEANAKLIVAAPVMLKMLIEIAKDKPLHLNHPDSKFSDKKDYDKAYKKWKKIDNLIKSITE